VVPPVGCRGRPGWVELSDKAYGFSACIHRTRSLRHYDGEPANGGKQDLETTCAEHYAHFEQIFDDTPHLRTSVSSTLARLQTPDPVAALRRNVSFCTEREPDLTGRNTRIEGFRGRTTIERTEHQVVHER